LKLFWRNYAEPHLDFCDRFDYSEAVEKMHALRQKRNLSEEAGGAVLHLQTLWPPIQGKSPRG
jgi:hypothetical protein